MSSSTSDIDYDDDGADRHKLADGEITGDRQSSNTFTTTGRIDWWQNQDPTATGPSTTPAMADANAQRRYAGDNRPVAVKQKVWEASVAYPERFGVNYRA